ncbi:hypothetical protein RA802_003041 [Vibrio fluvialis]|nr:hypothetical protein [Vibrio fluvialis]
MCKRTQDAVTVLKHMLAGKRYSKRQLSRHTPEDSGRIINYIRNKLLVPVFCDKSDGEARWYITEKERYRYYNQREQQKYDMKVSINQKRLERLSNQIVKINKDGQGDTLKGLVDKKSIKK